MPSQQALGGFVHGSGVERVGDVPDPPGQQCRTAAPVQDAEAIGAAIGGEARVPVVRTPARPRAPRPDAASCGNSAHRGSSWRMPVGQVDMRDLALGVNAGVGAAGDDAGNGFAAR